MISFTLKLYASIPNEFNFTCSIYHEEKDFDKWWEDNKHKYKNITKEEFKKFPFPNGVMNFNFYIEAKPRDINAGDVIAYHSPFSNKKIAHRVIGKWEENSTYFFKTSGDNNNYTEIINASYVNGKLVESKFLAFFERDMCK